MGLQGRRYRLVLSYRAALWIVTYLISSCSALPKPQTSIEDNEFSAKNSAPLIKPFSTQITLEVGLNYTLECEAKEPITWRALTPVFFELNQSSYNSPNNDTPYGNILYLNDVTAEYVGYFYCIKERELVEDGDYDILVEEFKAAKIYVFVNDSKVLLVPMSIPIISASQHEDIIIPCKPTMPDTVVELITNNQQVHSSETTSRYDPKRGFVIQIHEITEVGLYACRPQQPSPLNKKEEVNFLILFNVIESNDHKTKRVKIPEIHSNTNGHAVEGDAFNLTCSVETSYDVSILIKWETPLYNNIEGRLNYTNTTTYTTAKNLHKGKSVLTVTNTRKTDGGNYKCIAQDHSGNIAHNTYLMTILKNGESYINMSEPNKYYNIVTNASKNIMMNVNYRGFPTPSFNWYAPGEKLIQPSQKYEIQKSNSSISLQINYVELFDTGVYVLKANNGIDEKELQFNLFVKAKPQVSIENVYVQAGEQASVLCKTHAYPMAKIIWSYTPCDISPKWPSCKNDPVTFNSTRNSSESSKIERINELIFKPDRPGRMKCTATNKLGTSSSEGYVLIGDIIDNMTVYGVDENIQIAKGDEVILTCSALAYYYSAELDWFKDGQMIIKSSGVEFRAHFSNYSYKKIIKFKNIKDEHAGSYECRARVVDSELDYNSKFLSIVVHEPAPPVMVLTNLGDQHKCALGDSLELICKFEGIPKVNITWYKDNEKLNFGRNVLILDDKTVLKIPYINPTDEGLYKCVASNRLGNSESSSQVKITNMPGLKLGWVSLIVVFISMLIISIIFLGIRFIKDKNIQHQMKLSGLENFEQGALEQINPAMSLDEQADLLPYDRRFEFPRHKIKLGKKLGAGAFGVVFKALAEGIIPEEKETVVAVKMVKRTADNEVIKSLVSELKIMVHLGQHLNVLNLLGAVTKNIAKREVMVIVEYCHYGNVQSFLLRNRKMFINQINPISDKIDPAISEERCLAGDYVLNRISQNDSGSRNYVGRPNSSYYLGKSNLTEDKFECCPTTELSALTAIPEGENQITATESIQPDLLSNVCKSDSTETATINTSDLVSWAFQVARGMDYLSSRNVLHGDLAARNILLCEDNVVKICDFGLARSVYKNDNYRKQHKSLLPMKWLALESISDQVFSTYTDIWSFGIMLWEFFSLATVPYPGMDANQALYLKLKDGYRMEKPDYANDELYDIMLECWSFKPESRPLFHELEKKFARLLGEEVTSHYVDLNQPYLKFNTDKMHQSEKDYLALMGSPDEMAPAPPRYVNAMILPENEICSLVNSNDGCSDKMSTSSNINSYSLDKELQEARNTSRRNPHSSEVTQWDQSKKITIRFRKKTNSWSAIGEENICPNE